MDFVDTDIIMDANLTNWLNKRDNRENIFLSVCFYLKSAGQWNMQVRRGEELVCLSAGLATLFAGSICNYYAAP